jgi:hypothetical protein
VNRRALLKKLWKRNNRDKGRIFLDNFKKTQPCIKCGESRPCCLVFHHRNPALKKFDISHSRDKSISSLLSEMKKCDILCSNCHLELHANERLVEEMRFNKEKEEEYCSLFRKRNRAQTIISGELQTDMPTLVF